MEDPADRIADRIAEELTILLAASFILRRLGLETIRGALEVLREHAQEYPDHENIRVILKAMEEYNGRV